MASQSTYLDKVPAVYFAYLSVSRSCGNIRSFFLWSFLYVPANPDRVSSEQETEESSHGFYYP